VKARFRRPPKPAMKPATLKNLDIFRRPPRKHRRTSIFFEVRESVAAFVADFVPAAPFGLQAPPSKRHPSYSRLSRYDETGLVWLLQGRPVVALTEAVRRRSPIAAPLQSSRGEDTDALQTD
jgi:hypothetical protein